MKMKPAPLPLKDGWYEREFRRVYSQLYPEEKSLRNAMECYKGCGFPYVERDSHYRIEDLRFWMNSNKTIEDYREYDKKLKRHGSAYLFSDVKEIVGNFPVDVVFLSMGVSLPTFGDPEATIGKCLHGMKNNDIKPGNFANVLWNRGTCYYDALEDGLTREKLEFEVSLKEPTYERPLIVITERFIEGEMLGSYIAYLRNKGLGRFPHNKRKGIPAFSFIGRDNSNWNEVLDTLDAI